MPQPRPSRGRQPIAVFIVFALVAVTLLAALGCGADAGTSPSIDGPSGQYALASIDRVSLPARVFRGSGNDPLTGRFYNQLTIVVNAANDAVILLLDISGTGNGISTTSADNETLS